MESLRERYLGEIEVKVDDSFLFLELPPTELHRIPPRIPWLRAPHVGCGAGRSVLAVTARDEVLPCAYLRGPDFLAGSLGDEPLDRIWRESPVFRKLRDQTSLGAFCDACHLKATCLGGCRAAAFGVNETLESEDPGCWRCT
jgi:radical SAM protein with 4Fe4S-binding SPASM domain